MFSEISISPLSLDDSPGPLGHHQSEARGQKDLQDATTLMVPEEFHKKRWKDPPCY
jgi:hypothetical protein